MPVQPPSQHVVRTHELHHNRPELITISWLHLKNFNLYNVFQLAALRITFDIYIYAHIVLCDMWLCLLHVLESP